MNLSVVYKKCIRNIRFIQQVPTILFFDWYNQFKYHLKDIVDTGGICEFS